MHIVLVITVPGGQPVDNAPNCPLNMRLRYREGETGDPMTGRLSRSLLRWFIWIWFRELRTHPFQFFLG
jgi:hypothetical protein